MLLQISRQAYWAKKTGKEEEHKEEVNKRRVGWLDMRQEAEKKLLSIVI